MGALLRHTCLIEEDEDFEIPFSRLDELYKLYNQINSIDNEDGVTLEDFELIHHRYRGAYLNELRFMYLITPMFKKRFNTLKKSFSSQ